MKHFLRDSFVYAFDTCGVSFLYRLHVKRQGALVRIVVFHDVADATWFESVLALFAKKYHVVTPDEFHAQQFHDSKINVLLTFDDGYDSWVCTSAPLLKKYGMKGLFFVTTGILAVCDNEPESARFMKDRLHISLKKPLSWEGVATLVQDGHSIGGHTHTHPNVATLTPSQAREDVVENKQLLEQKIAKSLTDFAYPFGRKEHRSDSVLALLSEVGYTSVYTAIPGFVSSSKMQREIPRVCIEKNQPTPSIARWVEGGYDVFYKLHKVAFL